MTAIEHLLWAALMAPPPGAERGRQGAGVDHARRLDTGHAVLSAGVANVLPPAPAIVRQLVLRLLSYPALAAAH